MHLRLIGLFTISLILASCAGLLRQESPDRQSYALEIQRTPLPQERTVFDEPLTVRRFGVAQAYGQRNLVYRMGETEFESDYYNLFLIDPGEMIAQETRKWMARANLFKAVVPPGSRLEVIYALEGNVLELYGDFAYGRGEAVMVMQFFLVRDNRGVQDILLHGRYERRIPLDERSPGGLVRGYSQALASILLELELALLELAD
jgi:cholesterol transport system auxiliary component